ncbi:MAG: ADP-ribose pyrophosphatase YjhB (NUDIX family) [Pseudohongiellaceae bacterium]|jgi:ADP-ribose pyrophosphatase YjhB (NUDIX family)
MKYCSGCGSKISLKIPENDDRERHVCDDCGVIHYQNPNIIVCSLPCHEDQVLLCRRSIEPRYGLWTLPGGFMENNETTLEGAHRETLEEACARIEIHSLYSYYSLPHINQVHLFYRATLLDLDFAPGDESLEVKLFHHHEIPWEEIAFPAVSNTLEHYYRDLPEKKFPLHSADIIYNEDKKRSINSHH